MNEKSSAITEFLAATQQGSEVLVASLLTKEQAAMARGIIKKLSDAAGRAEKIYATRIVIGEGGKVELSMDPGEVEYVELTAGGGIELKSGMRMSTMLRRWRENQNLTVHDMIKDLNIDENTYRMLESGTNYRLPQDVLEAVGKKIGQNANTLAKAMELDIDFPVRYAPYSPSSPSSVGY